ncbi:MAG: hypothetical protein V7L11_00560 [Nostoc sp.]|uniref:hypothetical protein n=1 Tax=Nostoc sp. TaxID=1180 RepID=UPI002FFC5212
MNKTQYTFIPSSQSPVPSPLPLRVIQKSNRIAIATIQLMINYSLVFVIIE